MGGTLVVMPGFAELMGALALALPLGGLGTGAPDPVETAIAPVSHSEVGELPDPVKAPYPVSGQTAPLESLKVVVRQTRNRSQSDAQAQSRGSIRIEQRVYVRIAPRGVAARRNMLAQLPVQSRAQRYEEAKAEKCVPVSRIAGVETGSGNRLLLFLRNRGIMSVNLEKACRARDFYAGFYVERNEDGKLCVNRDTLQSRNGARCDIKRMMELKAVEE